MEDIEDPIEFKRNEASSEPAGVSEQIRKAKHLAKKLRKEQYRKEMEILRRHQYEDVIQSSTPNRLTKCYAKHFVKILMVTLFFYYVMLTLMFRDDYLHVYQIVAEDFYLHGDKTTDEFKVYRRLNQVTNFDYVEHMDQELKEKGVLKEIK